MDKVDKIKNQLPTTIENLNARKAASDLGKTAYRAGKITFDDAFNMVVGYLECLFEMGRQYSDIDEEIGHWKTSDASDALTSKQQFVSESGFSEGFIKQIAGLCHYFDEFENYRQTCYEKKKWPGIKEFSRIINKLNRPIKDFSPFIYNIWNTQQGNETDHFGSFPKIFMDNLIYYHTGPDDLIFDPFAGAGITIDSCNDFNRKYYCSDRIVKQGREKDIIKHDIINGFPENLPEVDLIFLDPPYWILAKKEYSEDESDLGNMTKEKFYDTIKMIINESKKREIKRIAYLIRPIWETGEDKWQWVDPMFDLYDMASDKYKIETRYVIPYSTQQYSALWVSRAKNKKQCLILNRELMILKLK